MHEPQTPPKAQQNSNEAAQMRFAPATSLLTVLETFAAANVVHEKLAEQAGVLVAQRGRLLDYQDLANFLKITESHKLSERIRRKITDHLGDKFPNHHREILDVATGMKFLSSPDSILSASILLKTYRTATGTRQQIT